MLLKYCLLFYKPYYFLLRAAIKKLLTYNKCTHFLNFDNNGVGIFAI